MVLGPELRGNCYERVLVLFRIKVDTQLMMRVKLKTPFALKCCGQAGLGHVCSQTVYNEQ